MNQLSQEEAILNHLKSGQSLTPIDALNLYGSFRLAARIDGLRREGYDIQTEIVKGNKKRWARYYIPHPVQMEIFLA